MLDAKDIQVIDDLLSATEKTLTRHMDNMSAKICCEIKKQASENRFFSDDINLNIKSLEHLYRSDTQNLDAIISIIKSTYDLQRRIEKLEQKRTC